MIPLVSAGKPSMADWAWAAASGSAINATSTAGVSSNAAPGRKNASNHSVVAQVFRLSPACLLQYGIKLTASIFAS